MKTRAALRREQLPMKVEASLAKEASLTGAKRVTDAASSGNKENLENGEDTMDKIAKTLFHSDSERESTAAWKERAKQLEEQLAVQQGKYRALEARCRNHLKEIHEILSMMD